MHALRLRSFMMVAAVACGIVAPAAAEPGYRLSVAAGDLDREQTVVSFDLPEASVVYRLEETEGNNIPLQADYLGRGSFILKNLKRQTTATFRLIPQAAEAPAPAAGQGSVQVRPDGKKLRLTIGGQSVFEYQAEKGELPRPDIKPIFRRGGYLHPVWTPSGKLLTDDYPPNHLHHHGIWFPWTKTEFEGRHPDFWNMGDGSGRVEFVSLDQTWSGPVHGGFLTRHRFVDLTAPAPKVALQETWEVRAYQVAPGAKPYFLFDLISRQECASSSPLVLPKYYYGGLGFRGNWAWNGKDKTEYLTSEGETNRIKGNETRARWGHISGLVNGERAGIAVLGHPDNFRAPQPMRLHPSEPFFCFAPSQLGEWEIKPGVPYVSRYRFVLSDGAPDAAELNRLWNDFASPPKVTLERENK